MSIRNSIKLRVCRGSSSSEQESRDLGKVVSCIRTWLSSLNATLLPMAALKIGNCLFCRYFCQRLRLGIDAFLRAQDATASFGSFFCIATKFFGGERASEADTMHKAIGGGGGGGDDDAARTDADMSAERSAFNSLSAAHAIHPDKQTSEPVHPRNRTERSEDERSRSRGSVSRCDHGKSTVLTSK